MPNHILVGLAIYVDLRLVQYNVLVELFNPHPFLLMVICQIHNDASNTYATLILPDLILLVAFHYRKVVEHIVPIHCKHQQPRNL